jgi:peptidoglycan/xylan/chitin deacetylase (PgdA/CDA1 family)
MGPNSGESEEASRDRDGMRETYRAGPSGRSSGRLLARRSTLALRDATGHARAALCHGINGADVVKSRDGTDGVTLHRASRYGALLLWTALLVAAFGDAMLLAGRWHVWMATAGVVLLLMVIGAGVALPASGVFARPVLRVATARKEVALTFDDGPDPRWTPGVLDALDRHQAKATFFVIGVRAAAHPELLRDIVRRGHEIANHTWSHSYLTTFADPRRLAAELTRANAAIEAATGRRARWFRPPVGLLSPRVARAARLAGLELVSWTATARDGVARTTVAEAVARLDTALTSGAILVLHDARITGDDMPIAAIVTGQILTRMAALGLRSVTLSELCAVAPSKDARDDGVQIAGASGAGPSLDG